MCSITFQPPGQEMIREPWEYTSLLVRDTTNISHYQTPFNWFLCLRNKKIDGKYLRRKSPISTYLIEIIKVLLAAFLILIVAFRKDGPHYNYSADICICCELSNMHPSCCCCCLNLRNWGRTEVARAWTSQDSEWQQQQQILCWWAGEEVTQIFMVGKMFLCPKYLLKGKFTLFIRVICAHFMNTVDAVTNSPVKIWSLEQWKVKFSHISLCI